MATISDELESCIACIRLRTPVVNEELSCGREEENIFDPYAIAFIKSGIILGHMPRQTFNKDITLLIE